jgi:hypothetical protein
MSVRGCVRALAGMLALAAAAACLAGCGSVRSLFVDDHPSPEAQKAQQARAESDLRALPVGTMAKVILLDRNVVQGRVLPVADEDTARGGPASVRLSVKPKWYSSRRETTVVSSTSTKWARETNTADMFAWAGKVAGVVVGALCLVLMAVLLVMER